MSVATDLDSSATVVEPPAPSLTWVDLVWIDGRIERWIRFGVVAREQILDRRRRRVGFEAGAIFAFVRWAANARGTIVSRIDIVQAMTPRSAGVTIAGITPGGVSLLRGSGWPSAQAVLVAIDAVEGLGIDPVEAAPDHWRQVHNRLVSLTQPVPYSLARHRAWRLRQELGAC